MTLDPIDNVLHIQQQEEEGKKEKKKTNSMFKPRWSIIINHNFERNHIQGDFPLHIFCTNTRRMGLHSRWCKNTDDRFLFFNFLIFLNILESPCVDRYGPLEMSRGVAYLKERCCYNFVKHPAYRKNRQWTLPMKQGILVQSRDNGFKIHVKGES